MDSGYGCNEEEIIDEEIEEDMVGLHIGNAANGIAIEQERSHFEAVSNLADECSYLVEQFNGQRMFGPPTNWTDPVPTQDCEIYIGHIPRGIYEDDLVPMLSCIGVLYKLRLMMDFNGNNRGFAFALFSTPVEANNACAVLNGFEILRGKRITVQKSVDNNCLYISELPYHTPEVVVFQLCANTQGVSGVYITMPDHRRRLCVYIRYQNHRYAALARRYLISCHRDVFNTFRPIIVDWKTRQPQNLEMLPLMYFGLYTPETGVMVRKITIFDIRDIC